MPSKSHRAASRQSQLKRRKKKSKAHPVFDTGPTQSETGFQDSAGAGEVSDQPEPGLLPDLLSQEQPSRPRRGPSRDAVPSSSYLGLELRQIGILTVLVGIILVVLTFVLGS